MIKRAVFLLIAGLVLAFPLIASPIVHASFDPNNIIDDGVFERINSMDATAIDNFLNSFPNSCISPNKGFTTPDPLGWSAAQSKYLFGGNVTAGRAIHDTSVLYNVNPQVILTTMQKEQSLVSGGAGCYPNEPDPATATSMTNQCGSGTRNCTLACTHSGGCMNIAMGYGCPSYCDAKDEGFSMQLTLGTWLLRFGEQRAYGNLTGYVGYEAGDEGFTYTGPMTPGIRQRSAASSPTYYDGSYTTLNGVSVSIANGSTASLYNFTPFTSGNQSFVNIFEGWFGATRGGYCISSQTGTQTAVTFRKYNIPRVDQANLLIYSGSSTKCVESHTWNVGVTSWASHVATNSPNIDSANAEVLYGDLNGDGIDEPVLVDFNHTGSGMVEFHLWNKDMNAWNDHIISNLPQTDLSNARIEFASVDGSGRDVPILIVLSGSGSGMVEFHVWNSDLRTWKWHIASNLPSINPADGTVVFGDVDGNGVDEPVLIGYRNQSSGMVEFHTWANGWHSWRFHTASNLASIDPANGFITFADVDGNGVDEAVLVATKNTGSGAVEFHTWQLGVTAWRYHTASNQPVF